jgi:metal-responsive CopG/Arc/MetJ family transcriptional regulator
MATTKKNIPKERPVRRVKAKAQAVLSVISVRISDEEKERIDEIMRRDNIKSYSDVLRMAIQMVQVPKNDESERAGTYH